MPSEHRLVCLAKSSHLRRLPGSRRVLDERPSPRDIEYQSLGKWRPFVPIAAIVVRTASFFGLAQHTRRILTQEENYVARPPTNRAFAD
jgi:hypothetical protein